MKKRNHVSRQILQQLENIKTVDCHSHTLTQKQYYSKGGLNLFTLSSYFERDFSSTLGIPRENLYLGCKNDTERWLRLKKALEKSRNVTYWRHNLVMFQNLFGLKEAELTDENWMTINEAIKERTQDLSWYDHVTKELCKLQTQILNIPWFQEFKYSSYDYVRDKKYLIKSPWSGEWEKEYFTGILRMELALHLHEKLVRKRLEERVNLEIKDIFTIKEGIRRLLQLYLKKGIVGIKLAHAYKRTLHSVPVSEKKVTQILRKVMAGKNIQPEELKELQDHVIFFLAELCKEYKLIFQIHTGVQTNWGNIPDSDPVHLISLLKEFPEVKFDLLHCGYPYSRMMGILGKHYPNVWVNMAWMYVISTAASRHILSEWLDIIPGYRILGFGSDVQFPEMIYAHLIMARECVADVLAEKVKKDFLSEEEALNLARNMFHDNPFYFYNLDSNDLLYLKRQGEF